LTYMIYIAYHPALSVQGGTNGMRHVTGRRSADPGRNRHQRFHQG
jgi:hypothetical protein